ncbi:autotransporter outer membrane beta-barrel domain-containing protein [Devosia sp. MC1541]|uniref:autotransporter outer membrane beta-barrel domain-containing protein n=1 Tax=Devosia sp. MC1541 TaxID=2725264 RepID=UPI00145DD06D
MTVETQGSASYSLEAQLAGKIQAFGGTFTTSGASAHGIAAFDGGVVEASNVDIAVTGTDASAIAIWNVSAADTNSVTINGGSLSASAAPVMLVDGGIGTIALNGAIDIVAPTSTPRSVLLAVKESSVGSSDVDVTLTDVTRVHGDIDVTGAGNVRNATIDGSEWIGDLFADSNNTANIALKGARWTGMATNASTVSLNPSVWTITGDSNAAYVDNAGELRFDPAAAGFPILVARDYFGRDGRLRLNTQLDGDGSPSNLLVIDGGTATGKTTVSINNAGGSGQQTIGDGILVIDTRAGGMTARDAFALGGRVAAGAYEYVLQRGSLTGGDDDDWFLRSHVPIAAQADIPLYRPEVPLYAPITDLSRRMGMTLVGTLHERVGEQAGMGPSSDARLMNAVWTRAIVEGGRAQWGGELNVNAEDVHLLGLQTGVDIYRGEHEDGRRDHIGVYGALAASKAQVSGYALGASQLPVGVVELGATAVGAYWTHYEPNGGYIDGVAQAHWTQVAAISDYGMRLDTEGLGLTASVEAGQPIALDQNWTIEPQAQLIYQTMRLGSTEDDISPVSFGSTDALTGRVGFRLRQGSSASDKKLQPYVKANLWHGFRGIDTTSFASHAMETPFGSTSADVGVGFTAKISRTASVYGHVDHRWSLGEGQTSASTQGVLGVRVNW